MVGAVEVGPEVGTGGLGSQQNNSVLLSSFPLGVIKIHSHEGLHFNSVPKQEVRLHAGQGHEELAVLDLLDH